jgi:hypothetical protein
MRGRLLAGGLMVTAFLVAPAAQATNLGCDAGTIKGAYALSATGFQGTAPNFLPVAVVRLALFDGVSKFRGDGWASVGGDPQTFSSDGTYKVAKNCTVTMDGEITIGRVNRQFGVIADRGRKIVTTRIDQGQTVVLTYERVR